jgi:hypothetical protein
LIDADGRVFGSLCHFSEVPTLVYDEDLELLLQVPRALADRGLEPCKLASWAATAA